MRPVAGKPPSKRIFDPHPTPQGVDGEGKTTVRQTRCTFTPPASWAVNVTNPASVLSAGNWPTRSGQKRTVQTAQPAYLRNAKSQPKLILFLGLPTSGLPIVTKTSTRILTSLLLVQELYGLLPLLNGSKIPSLSINALVYYLHF